MRYMLNGHSLVLDAGRCNGCGRCEEVCPHAVFRVVERKAAIARRESCMECGACRMNCPTEAIQVSSGVGCAAAVINAMRTGAQPGCESCG
jgi:ferredoxin